MSKSVDNLKTWEIWSEGYAASGDSGQAMRHGAIEAPDFPSACGELALEDAEFAACFDPERLTYWGCRLFDNETDARRSFG